MSQNLQNYTLSLTHILSVHRQVYKLLKASNPQGHQSLLVTKLVHLFDEQDPEKQLSESLGGRLMNLSFSGMTVFLSLHNIYPSVIYHLFTSPFSPLITYMIM